MVEFQLLQSVIRLRERSGTIDHVENQHQLYQNVECEVQKFQDKTWIESCGRQKWPQKIKFIPSRRYCCFSAQHLTLGRRERVPKFEPDRGGCVNFPPQIKKPIHITPCICRPAFISHKWYFAIFLFGHFLQNYQRFKNNLPSTE